MVVSGYIRKVQSSLPHEDNSFYIIPDLIQSIILIFYTGEYFTKAGDDIIIDESNPCKISYDNSNMLAHTSTAYGRIDITDDGINRKYIWNFKCLNIKPDSGDDGKLLIGIDGSQKSELNKSFNKSTGKYYGFECDYYNDGTQYGSITTHHWDSYRHDSDDWNSMDEEFETGDEVRMELDTKDRTLIYYKNGNKIGNWFEQIEFDKETTYNMVVSLGYGNYCLEMTDFKTSTSE